MAEVRHHSETDINMQLRNLKAHQAEVRQRKIARTLTSKAKRCSFKKRARRGYAKWKMDEVDRAALDALLGRGGRSEQPIWSDMRALGQVSRTATSLLLQFFRDAPAERTFYWITLCDDVGTTSDRIPIVRLRSIRDKTSRALRAAGLNALMGLHIHPLMNYPQGGQGRSLLFHYHAIAWTDDVSFSATSFADAIESARAWHNELGAPVVYIEPLDRKSDVRTKARYMCRSPHDAKNRMPCHRRSGHFIFMDTMAGYRPELALRACEAMSQISLTEVFSGIGEGNRIADQLRSSLVKWHRQRTLPIVVPSEFDVWALWARLRRRNGSKLFMPYRFSGGGATPRKSLV